MEHLDNPELDLIPATPGWVWVTPIPSTGLREIPIVGWHVYRSRCEVAIPVLAPIGIELPDNWWIDGRAQQVAA